MVRAILDGTKTQTRRVAKLTSSGHVKEVGGHRRWHPADPEADLACPYGQVGDRLWVRETHATHSWGGAIQDAIYYRATPDRHSFLVSTFKNRFEDRPIGDLGKWTGKWTPAIHMPRWASRIELEITGRRLERLSNISEADALAEGIYCERVIVDTNCNGGYHQEVYADRYFFSNCRDEGYEFATEAYEALWVQINGADSWAADPLVWVVEFRKI